MKAVVLKEPGVFAAVEIPKPETGKGEILVRVKTCAVCGTDLRILEGKKTKGVRYPSVIGHEIAGIIEESGFPAGDGGLVTGVPVCIAPVIPCHSCRYCLEGRENACKNRTAIGYEYDGGFAEYVKIPAKAVEFGHVQLLPEGMSFEEGSLIEPLSCCLNGIKKANLRLGDVCLIVGAGPIGLMHVQLARAAGAGMVILSEPNPQRRAEASRFGADKVVDPSSESLQSVVMDATKGYGVDCLIMAIGVPAIVDGLLKLLRKGGTMNLFAGFPDTGICTLEANTIHYNEITLNGTSASTRQDYMTAMELVAKKKVNVKDLVSHRYGLDDFPQAYQTAKAGSGIKIMILP